METTTKTMIAMVMSMTSPPVRIAPTKATPKWARTTDGIVYRRERVGGAIRIQKALRLPERLMRQFAIGCCRSPRVWDACDTLSRKVVDAAERFADGLETEDALNKLVRRMSSRRGGQMTGEPTVANFTTASYRAVAKFNATSAVLQATGTWHGANDELSSIETCCREVCSHAVDAANWYGIRKGDPDGFEAIVNNRATESRYQGRLLAGIAAPDWCLAGEWRTSTAVALARVMYESRDFSAMPILADALQDAGCDDEAWLARMRDPEWPWCRGCHVLDSLLPELVLGREGGCK